MRILPSLLLGLKAHEGSEFEWDGVPFKELVHDVDNGV